MIVIVAITLVVVFLVVFSLPYDSNNTIFNKSPFYIKEDDTLLEMALKARSNLLNTHGNSTISKLDFAILLANPIGSWSIATYNGKNVSSPQQCIFLPMLAAGVNWCLEQGKDPHCLEMAAGPMMNDMSSVHAGILVDIITGAPNRQFLSPNGTDFQSWLKKRELIEKFLSSNDLLGNQTIINKFYPSNSGSTATWGEGMIENQFGENLMTPHESALLMLYLIRAGILSEGQSYMSDLISRQTFSPYTSIGFGLPPGTVLHSVLGTSTQDVNEIAHFILPNGKEMIFAVFSNGYQNNGKSPYQSSILGMFAGDVIRYLGLDQGNPPKIVMTSVEPNCTRTGSWAKAESAQAYNGTYYYTNGTLTPGGGILPSSTITWTFNITVSGLYELCVWFPGGADHTTVTYQVQPGDGLIYYFTINQVHYGARWILLDSFYLVSGNQAIVSLSNLKISSEKIIVADSIKFTSWPSYSGIPGYSRSTFIINKSPY